MKLLYSLDAIYKAPWELFGILFFLGLGYAAWKKRKQIDWFYVTIPLGLVFAAAWRAGLGITSDRYHSIFIFPALFFSFYLIWRGPWPRKISCCLLAIVVVVCVFKDLRYNPHEAEICALYNKVKSDSKNFHSSYGVSFTNASQREQYYTGIPVSGNDRKVPTENIFFGLKGNLSFFDGDYDAIYVFLKTSTSEGDLTPEILQLAPSGQIALIGQCYVDRKQKRRITIFRYSPKEDRNEGNVEHAELLPNGDFRELLTPELQKREITKLRRLAPRFESENARLPAKWRIYQSLRFQTTNFASIKEKKSGSVLYMEADNSYLAVITPTFPMEENEYLIFHVYAISESFLQISREIVLDSGERDFYPIMPVRISPGANRSYEISLPVKPGYKNGNIWFWLHHGKIELSDVKIRGANVD